MLRMPGWELQVRGTAFGHCGMAGRDLHLMHSLIGERRTLTHEAKNVFDYEDEEHTTNTLRGLRVPRGAIVLKYIELRSHPYGG